MNLNKGDFVEIEFTGRLKGGEVFDSNRKEDLEKLHHGHDHKIEAKPFVFALGRDMFVQGIDEFLVGKGIGEYEVNLTPEKAFGKRLPQLVQMIPSKVFRESKLSPAPGAVFNFDGRVGKILTVSGGRIMVDFNNPLAGKDLVYKVKVKRKVEEINEKIKSFVEFLFRKDFKFEVKDKNLTLHVDKGMGKFVELFKDKFKEVLDLELEVKEIEDKKEVKNKEEKDESKAGA